MSWAKLDLPGQAAFEQAWKAATAGSLPIGSALTDARGNIIRTGRNRLFEPDPPPGGLSGNHLAHAEMNALAGLRTTEIDTRQLTLYSTMEPCPMCTGAIRMMHVGTVRFAARDPVAGSLRLLEATEFMRRSGICISGPEPDGAEFVSITLTTAVFLQLYPDSDLPERMIASFQELNPEAAELGQYIHRTGVLQQFIAGAETAETVYNELLNARRG